jgi:hypothetical protein
MYLAKPNVVAIAHLVKSFRPLARSKQLRDKGRGIYSTHTALHTLKQD